MAEIWDTKRGLVCLLEALDNPQWDADSDRDIVEVEALLTELASRSLSTPRAA